MKILSLLRKLRQNFSSYQPIVEVVINRDHLLNNLHQYQKLRPKLHFAPVLKSNAYGHGLVEIAKIVDREEVAFLVVDSYFEAKVLRQEGIRSKILVIGYVDPGIIAKNRLNNVAFTITSLDQLKLLVPILRRPTVLHLKVDTGLHRQGLDLDELEPAISLLQNPQIEFEGLCSHLADAEDTVSTKKQLENWEGAVSLIHHAFPELAYYHIAASGGVETVAEATANVVRLGRGLYGIGAIEDSNLQLKPVLSMKTPISSIRTVQPGESIGYSGTYTAKKSMKVATVPIGYYEGIDRRLSNKGSMNVNGVSCPIVGRISMNITSLDVSALPDLKLGDPVVAISDNKNDSNSVEAMALQAETIGHEILIHIPQQLRRTVR